MGYAYAGISIPSEDIEVISPLPPCSILSAELEAIERALQKEPLRHPYNTYSKSSQHTLNSSHTTNADPSLIKEIPNVNVVTFQWIPSHVGI